MDGNQHNLVKTARNFDASPAVTTGMPQDPFLVPFRGRNGQVGGMGRQPFKFADSVNFLGGFPKGLVEFPHERTREINLKALGA